MDLFEAIFSKGSSSVAVLFEEERIAYDDLRSLTQQFGLGLRRLGMNPGDRVALLLHDSPQFIAAFVSICSSGAIAVPINMGLTLAEQRAVLNDCGATMALIEADLYESTDALTMLPNLKKVVVVNGDEKAAPEQSDSGPAVWLLEDLFKQTSELPLLSSSSDSQAPAFILYTSGSTGEPKGAVHSQADIFYTNETYCRQILNVRESDRLFSSSRLPFAYGLGNSFTFPLLNGATTILCREKPTPSVISQIFSRLKPTIFFGVPVVYRLLLDHHRHVEPLNCASLRLCISAGEALPAPLGEEWQETFNVEILDGIGSTEMLHMFMSNHEGRVKYGSSGELLDGYEARLLNEDGEETPFGVEGNLWIKGASAAQGYWQRPELTAQTFVDGWVRTGDLYRCDEDDYWTHMGRSDDCFKSSGQWVSPVEVEGVLLRRAGVNRVAVVEDFDAAGLPCPAAFIVSDENVSAEELEDELRELVESSLARFKRPQRYFFVADLPYTATGKVQRFKLRKSLLRQQKE